MKIDMDALLAPIHENEPAGRNMEYEQSYDDIRQAQESDPDYLPQGEWTTELRKADWPKVARLSTKVLCQDSKDLQVACWLTEGLSQQHGIPGLLAGVRYLTAFIGQYWDSCWPKIDEDGAEIRHGNLNRLDRQTALWLNCHCLLGQPESSLEYWQKVLAYEHRVAMNPDSKAAVGSDDDFSMESYNRWAATLSANKIAELNETVIQLADALTTFETVYGQMNVDADSDAIGQTRSVINDTQDFLKRLFDRVAPAYDDVMTLNVLATDDERASSASDNAMADVQKQVMSRDLAISQMLTIAHFFRQTEPSSPVPFLMERAARWAGMTLTEWLEEMLQDDNSMRDINNVLKGQGRE